MKWLLFAYKNTRRNGRRSLVTIVIVALGTVAILLSGGFALYTYESLAQSAARMTGHLILGNPDQFTQEEDKPLQYGLSDWEKRVSELMADPAVRAALPSVSFSGLVSNGDKSTVMIGLGVAPDSEFKIKGPFLKMLEGQVLVGGQAGAQVMLGDGLARSLKARPGTQLTLLSSTTDGAMNALDVTVTGIFTTGVTEVDKRMLYMDLPSAQRLLNADKVSTVGVFLASIEKTASARQRLSASYPSLSVRTWEEEATFYQSVRALYNRIFGALGLIIGLIVVAVVTNVMAMSIVERTREIGTLRAIGTLPSQLNLSFAIEGTLLGLVGVLLGWLIAFGISMLLYFLPIQMPPPPGRSSGYPLNITVDLRLYLSTALAMIALACATSALVARKTVRMAIAQALSHN